MIDERFSAKSFEDLGIDSDLARRLAEELAEEVNAELHGVIEPALRGIVEQLNVMGHDLKVEELNPGSLSFRDDLEDSGEYRCKLRLAVDTVVSSGYAHLSSSRD
jgi:hypothetical protein